MLSYLVVLLPCHLILLCHRIILFYILTSSLHLSVHMESGARVKMEDADGAADLDVDIVSLDGVGGCSKLAAADDPDATECSSSFGDTMSGSEDDGRPSEISDIEVDSPFCRYPPNGDAGNLLDAAASNNMDRLLK
jgi:hypothetical protein